MSPSRRRQTLGCSSTNPSGPITHNHNALGFSSSTVTIAVRFPSFNPTTSTQDEQPERTHSASTTVRPATTNPSSTVPRTRPRAHNPPQTDHHHTVRPRTHRMDSLLAWRSPAHRLLCRLRRTLRPRLGSATRKVPSIVSVSLSSTFVRTKSGIGMPSTVRCHRTRPRATRPRGPRRHRNSTPEATLEYPSSFKNKTPPETRNPPQPATHPKPRTRQTDPKPQPNVTQPQPPR